MDELKSCENCLWFDKQIEDYGWCEEREFSVVERYYCGRWQKKEKEE